MSYANHYLELEAFISYCKNLNVKTDESELEYYERKGIMLPMVRTILPEDYIKSEYASRIGTANISHNRWPELKQLFDRRLILPHHYAQLSDEELIDSFDRALDGNNPHIMRPSLDNYQSWDSYEVLVEHHDNHDRYESTANHYYSRWQVYQLYEIQKFPDLYKNRLLIDNLSNEIKERYWLPRAYNPEVYRSFNGKAKCFDALSYYITMYQRESERTFAPIQEQHQIKRLDEQQLQEYQNRLSAHAKLVVQRYSLEEQELYRFLIKLLNLLEDYQKAERLKLADELENDIVYQARLIMGVTGKKWEEIGEELGKHTVFLKRRFRHLDPLTKEHDETRELLVHCAKTYNDDLAKMNIQMPTHSFSENDIDGLINFCEEKELNVFSFSASGMIATEDEIGKKFRRTVRYTNLKNILTSLEYFLRSIAPTIPAAGSGLTGIVRGVMANEPWFSLCESNINRGLVNGKNLQDFFLKLTRILQDSSFTQTEDNFWARNFLISILARNLTIHNYPIEDWFYGELFGEMLRAAFYAFLYSWHVAKREGWV